MEEEFLKFFVYLTEIYKGLLLAWELLNIKLLAVLNNSLSSYQ